MSGLDAHEAADLSDEHRALLRASAINEEVAEQRGYRTIARKTELRGLGFADSQCRVPALLIPIRGVSGQVVTYQARPRDPRVVNDKALKYETPKGSRMCLDVPVAARAALGDPQIPLYVTEGARKADAGVSAGLCTIAILGVWNWRGTNDRGGKLALADWDSIALNGRQVYLVFDSDILEKAAVHTALSRLKGFLDTRGARVSVVYLPPGENGAKVGLDDFLAGGAGVDDLLARAEPELRPLSQPTRLTGQYEQTEAGETIHHKPAGRDGGTVPVVLANFRATIIEEVIEDDGVEKSLVFGISASICGRTESFRVPAERFASMNWVTENLGASAVVSAGFGNKDHLRVAIQMCSGDIPRHHLYRHLGWRRIDGRHVFLHAGGGIGQAGEAEGVEVELDSPLDLFRLPLPRSEEDLRSAVGECTALFTSGLARDVLTFALFAVPWCAAIGDADFSVHLVGETGGGKTELAALVQRHFGAEMTAQRLPGSWSSTANANEELAFLAKDVVAVIDDFVPKGSIHDIRRAHAAADRIIRSQANRSGRARSRADGSRRPVRPPRGLIVSTGEEIPAGHSAQARMQILVVEKGEVCFDVLTERQRAGDRYCVAMAGFVRWLAPRLEQIRAERDKAVERDRQELLDGLPHRRTASIGAQLLFGLGTLLDFALEVGAIDQAQHAALRSRGRTAILESLCAQADHLVEADPARSFLTMLAGALQSGEAHLQDHKTGGIPMIGATAPEAVAMLVGWHRTADSEDLSPRGAAIGFIHAEREDVYLVPEAAMKAAWKMGQGDPTATVVSKAALSKALDARSLLLSTDVDNNRRTKTVRLVGRTRGVYHLSLASLFPDTANSANSANTALADPAEGGVFPSAVRSPGQGTRTPTANTTSPATPGTSTVRDVRTVRVAGDGAGPEPGGDASAPRMGMTRWEG